MRGRDAEPHPLLCHVRGREPDPDGRHVPLVQPIDDGLDLGHEEDHERHDGTVIMTIDNQTHLLKPPPEVLRVPGQPVNAVHAQVGRGDMVHRGDDLGHDRGGHAHGVGRGVGGGPEVVDQRLGAADVAPGRAEALGEGAHHDVNVLGIEAEVVDDPTAPRSHGPHGVSLVQVEVGVVLLLQGDDLR